MGKVMMTRRKLAQFFNWRVSVTLTDGRVLVGVLMAVDRHVNLVLCHTEEYRRYKVRGKPEGKELKRMLGFIVVRGVNILYVQPEELGKEEIVEPVKARKAKANAKSAPAATPAKPAAAALPQLPAGMPALPNMAALLAARPAGMPALPGFPGGQLPNLQGLSLPLGFPMGGLPGGVGGLPSLPGMPGLPQARPGGLPGGMPALPKAS
mmetsp:Transcript_62273/g.148636  ORF Transcript_62273/g.148636 Transcript_62273/m.148636 type:complete len:208 (-) Transcript_62273:69-692(-)